MVYALWERVMDIRGQLLQELEDGGRGALFGGLPCAVAALAIPSVADEEQVREAESERDEEDDGQELWCG